MAPAAALKAAIDCQSDAVGVMDLSLRFLAINSAWMETMGFGQEAIGRTALELFNDPWA